MLQNLTKAARAAHTSIFGSGFTVSYTAGGTTTPLSTARAHRERIETREGETGTQRVAAREVHVDASELSTIRTDGTMTVNDVVYAIEGSWLMATGQHVVRCRRTLAAEVARGRYRGTRPRRPPNY